MSGFKDRVSRDIHKIFLNVDKFAEERTVIYDGVTYDGPEHEGIPIVLTGPVETDREHTRKGGRFFRTYSIAAAADELGMLRIELEELDE